MGWSLQGRIRTRPVPFPQGHVKEEGMDCDYLASLDIGSESMACCVLSNIEGDMAASLIDLQENGPAFLGDDRGPCYPLMDGDSRSARIRTRFALMDRRIPPVLADSHAELELIARPHVPGADTERSLFKYFFRDEDEASLGANKWLPNPKIIYQLAAKGYLPEILDASGHPVQVEPGTLMQHLITQVVRNFVLKSTSLGNVDGGDVDLILTVPNVYSLPHTQALSEFVQDHTDVRTVRVVHESDAIAYYASGLVGGLRGMVEALYGSEDTGERTAFITLLRKAYQDNPKAGVYIVTVDIGRGSADLSLVHIAWPETQHEYHVLARTGSNKAGNQLSYTLAQYYSSQLRAAYDRLGLTDTPGLAEHLWDFCSREEQSRAPDRQQGYALDLLQRLITSVKESVNEHYCLDGATCSYDLQRGMARGIADHILQYLGSVMEAPPAILGAPDSSERLRLRDALAESLILPVGWPLGWGDPGKLVHRSVNWVAGIHRRVAASASQGETGPAGRGATRGRPRTPVLDMAAWERLGEELRDQSEDSPRILLENLDKAARARDPLAAGGNEDHGQDPRRDGSMHKDNTLVVLAGQGSQFRPLQASLREVCRSVFGCPDSHILALTGREAKEACCWGALSFVLQRPLHIGATALHGTYGFLDAGPEGFIPIDMAALNSGRDWAGSFKYAGFRYLVFTPRAVTNVEELGREYTSIIGFNEKAFEVRRTPEGLQVNGREVRLPVEGQALVEEEMRAKLWPEQIIGSATAARKRSVPRAPRAPNTRARRGPGKRAIYPNLTLTLLLLLLLSYPAQGLIFRNFRPLEGSPLSPGASALRSLPPDSALQRPPAALLASLLEGSEEYAQGTDTEAEAALANALLSLPLHQRLLKVAVATLDNRRVALVKLQAGDMQTGLFRVPDLESDAVNALRMAFELPLDLQRIDLWSVVPGGDATGPVHKPVFSVSADRADFAAATRRPREARDILGDLGLVQFAPQFLRYAGGEPPGKVAALLPDTARSAAPLSDTWGRLREDCSRERPLPDTARARVVVRIPVTDNSVALTIDDGPHPLVTPLFIDILQRYGVHATFFIVGEKVEEFPELLQRLVDAGHEIGNHTYNHPRLGQLPEVDALTEIRGGALAIHAVSDRSTPLLRPPGGGLATDVLRAASASDSTIVLWTHNTNDWLRPSPEEAAANALRDLRPGSIILMHQGSMESVRALPLILAGVRERGLRVCTVGEMLRRAPVAARPIAEIMAMYEKHELGKE